MVLYSTYVWLRKARRGRLETQRKRACFAMLMILAVIVLDSAHLAEPTDAWAQLTDTGTPRDSAAPAMLVHAMRAALP